ncbi:MAG: tRNA pseudouridine(38-40) synthase TruA [Clostridia bacterium]|nr:tRNA pseudouridine(38-40) synthase TruA [Clostridia bacterium]
MKKNIKLLLSYDGTDYHGWQMQENAVTVQECVTKAAEKIFSQKISVNGCSRTDSGVHANEFCCNFRFDGERSEEKIILGMNSQLPDDIRVFGCEYVEPDFHARFDCKGKEYIYKVWNGKTGNPFMNRYSLFYPYELDDVLLDLQSKAFIGTHDFAAFCAAGSIVKDTVRTVKDFSVKREGDLVTFSVTGDGFLYNMVRIMVGTLIYINNGKIEKDTIPDIILSKDRVRAGITARPEGLYLNKVFY